MAIHEAGHAVVGLVVDAGEVIAASIASTLMPHTGDQLGGGVLFGEIGDRERTRQQILDGIAAEEILLGDRSAGAGGSEGSDLHAATLSALAFEASYGFGVGFAYLSPSDEDRLFDALRTDRFLQLRVDKVLGEQFERAKKIVEGHRQEVERIGKALLAKGSLTGAEIHDLYTLQPCLKLAEPSESQMDRL